MEFQTCPPSQKSSYKAGIASGSRTEHFRDAERLVRQLQPPPFRPNFNLSQTDPWNSPEITGTVDGRNPAPAKKPWNDSIPL